MNPDSPRINDTVVSPKSTSGWAVGCSRARSASWGVRHSRSSNPPPAAGTGGACGTGRREAGRRREADGGMGRRIPDPTAAAKTKTSSTSTAGAPTSFNSSTPGRAAANPASVPSSVSRALSAANSTVTGRPGGAGWPDERPGGSAAGSPSSRGAATTGPGGPEGAPGGGPGWPGGGRLASAAAISGTRALRVTR